MASRGKIVDHIQISLAGALSVGLVFFVIKYLLDRSGHPDWSNKF